VSRSRRVLALVGAVALTCSIGLVVPGAASAAAPSAPVIDALTSKGGRKVGYVTLRWAKPAANGAAITDFRYARSLDGGSTWSAPVSMATTGTTKTVPCPNFPAAPCRYRIYAVNVDGSSPASAPVTIGVALPGAPGLSLKSAAGPPVGMVTLRWFKPTDTGGAAATDYEYRRSTNGGQTWGAWTSMATTATSKVVACPAFPSGACTYQVRAKNVTGVGPPSTSRTISTTVPSAARSLTARTTDNATVALAWRAPTSTGGATVSYDVQISTDGASTWQAVASGLSATGTIDVSSCTAATACAYRVIARNSVGNGPASAIVVFSVVPSAPRGLGLTKISENLGTGAGTMSVTWARPYGGLVSDYEVQRCDGACTSLVGTWISVDANATSGTTTTCTAGAATCSYRVRGNNRNGGPAGPWAYRVHLYAPTTVSAASGSTAGEILVSWSPPERTPSFIVPLYYQFWSCTTSCGNTANWTLVPDLVVDHPSPSNTAAVPCAGGTTCHVRVQFGADTSTSMPSAAVTAVGAQLAGAPTDLSATTGTGSGEVDLAWTAPVNIGDPALTHYEFRRSIDSGSTWTGWTTTGSAATTSTDSSCGADITCTYEVRAVNAVGSGPSSGQASGTGKSP
jgi:hypothetical protein